ncbi:hypothetical protein scyTo_0000928 [Scyliorhinus torazame]|uniref:Uncharacterized protein n=1 Tax=Scyliorhinus torazame TaxID=75743 RepID=A0A401P6D6_SCYTO|nr:hypothetical protein [Scyliorhinus torazame]
MPNAPHRIKTKVTSSTIRRAEIRSRNAHYFQHRTPFKRGPGLRQPHTTAHQQRQRSGSNLQKLCATPVTQAKDTKTDSGIW